MTQDNIVCYNLSPTIENKLNIDNIILSRWKTFMEHGNFRFTKINLVFGSHLEQSCHVVNKIFGMLRIGEVDEGQTFCRRGRVVLFYWLTTPNFANLNCPIDSELC